MSANGGFSKSNSGRRPAWSWWSNLIIMSPEKLVASSVWRPMPGIVMAESGRCTSIVSCLLVGSWGIFNMKTVDFSDAALAASALRGAMCDGGIWGEDEMARCIAGEKKGVR